ncbi:MAG: transposase [Mariniphaga sp.]|nr:transposase [Mariniphaga sp.]
MQQIKGIQKIATINDNPEKNVDTIFQTLALMKISRIGQFFDSTKRCGVNVSDILMLLLLMPFYHLKSVPFLVKSGLTKMQGIECGNSVFYDLKNNPNINWRSLLYLVALRFRNLAGKINPEMINSVRAFIFDDSPLPKSGIKTELVSRVHDHVSGDYIFGYKILVMGYWDGLSFYPLDFSLHREKGGQVDDVKQRLTTANKRLSSQRQEVKKLAESLAASQQTLKSAKKENKDKQTKSAKKQIEKATGNLNRAKQKLKKAESKYVELGNKAIELRAELKEARKKHPDYGLTKKQMSQQFKKYRDAKTPGAQREAEADVKKTTNMMAMLRRAVNRGFQADYVLTDSWFCNYGLVKLVSSLNKKHNINLLTMAKMCLIKYRLTSNNQFYNALELLAKFERKAISARSHKAKYIKVPVNYGDVRVNLFFVKLGKSTSWKLLVTTDLAINFQKLMDVYQIRWSIELFFRENKQYLNLGKSKSTSFDAQIADATISLIQYTILSFHQRMCDYSSFDGIFIAAMEDAMQYSIAGELQKMFWLVLEIFCDFTGIDLFDFTESIFRDEKVHAKLQQLNPVFYDNLQKHRAA